MVWLLLLSLSVLGACAPGVEPPQDPQLVQADGLPSSAGPDDELLEWAQQTLTGSCMVGAGFSYFVNGWDTDEQSATRPDQEYGLDDIEWAAQHGYGLRDATSVDGPDAKENNPNAAYYAGLPEEQQRAYGLALQGIASNVIEVNLPNGVVVAAPGDGCRAQMRTALYGNNERWARASVLYSNLHLEVRPLVEADASYSTALASWRVCMSENGYDVADPVIARERASAGYQNSDQQSARDNERAIATSEAHCASTTGLVRIARDLDAHYRGKVIEHHRAEVDSYLSMRTTAIGRAQDLLTTVANEGHGSTQVREEL